MKPEFDTSITFEEALKELEIIVRKLEEGRVPLEETVTLYERGAALKDHCKNMLDKARVKIQEIMVSKEGEITVKPSSLQQLITD